jgi:hypothetical protein
VLAVPAQAATTTTCVPAVLSSVCVSVINDRSPQFFNVGATVGTSLDGSTQTGAIVQCGFGEVGGTLYLMSLGQNFAVPTSPLCAL